MFEKFVLLLVKLRQNVFLRVTQRTLAVLFPLILIGNLAQVLASFLSVNGFIGSIFYVDDWLPHYAGVRLVFENISKMTLGLVAVLATYQVARYTAKFYQRDGQMAGLGGLVSFLLLIYAADKNMVLTINWRLLGFASLFLGLLIGFFSGYLFKILTKEVADVSSMHSADILARAFMALKPLSVSLLSCALINHFLSTFIYRYLNQNNDFFQALSLLSHGLGLTLLVGILTNLCAFIGISGPYTPNLYYDSRLVAANLNATFTKHSLPYQYNGNTLYQAYGVLGGAGCSLALVIALLLFTQNKNEHNIAKATLFPVFFNSNAALLVGLPVLFNPLYLLGFVMIPVLNMLVAALFLKWGWLSYSVYPVPTGTPGPLIAFIGSGADWRNLVFSLLLLVLDIWCYKPFVLLAQKVSHRLKQSERRE